MKHKLDFWTLAILIAFVAVLTGALIKTRSELRQLRDAAAIRIEALEQRVDDLEMSVDVHTGLTGSTPVFGVVR